MIIWMIIYLLATPVFAFYLPLYSFWHFDDFSWGNTRIVVGEDGKKVAHAVEYIPVHTFTHVYSRFSSTLLLFHLKNGKITQ